MGIQGLTSYLAEHRSAVSYQQVFEASPSQEVPLVVDAWGCVCPPFSTSISSNLADSCGRPFYSLIYAFHHQVPASFGGEHIDFARLVKRTIEGWRAVGFEVVLILDGTLLVGITSGRRVP